MRGWCIGVMSSKNRMWALASQQMRLCGGEDGAPEERLGQDHLQLRHAPLLRGQMLEEDD